MQEHSCVFDLVDCSSQTSQCCQDFHIHFSGVDLPSDNEGAVHTWTSQRMGVTSKHHVQQCDLMCLSERKATDKHTNLGLYELRIMHAVLVLYDHSLFRTALCLHCVYPAWLQTGGVLTDTQGDAYILEVQFHRATSFNSTLTVKKVAFCYTGQPHY